jgi:hypothetical protein
MRKSFVPTTLFPISAAVTHPEAVAFSLKDRGTPRLSHCSIQSRVGPKILEITNERADNPAMSPDGHHIAFPLFPRNRIRIVDLHGAIENEITVSGAEVLSDLNWSADGAGFFCGDLASSATRLLHIQRDGASQVLWDTTREFNDLGNSVAGWPTPCHIQRQTELERLDGRESVSGSGVRGPSGLGTSL